MTATPGPWRAERLKNDRSAFTIWAGDDIVIASVPHPRQAYLRARSGDDPAADAALIAAAPALADALDALLREKVQDDLEEFDSPAEAQARAALRAAGRLP